MKTHHDTQFDPYDNNGGTSLAISGPDYCIVAADTRQSSGYSINTRNAPKAFKLANGIVLGTSGFYADAENFVKEVRKKMAVYKYNHEKEMSVASVAQLMQAILYQKRFFPFYTFNILGGLDAEGRGAVYSFDPIGSYEREGFRAGGSAASLIQPFLDNQIGQKNIATARVETLTLEEAVKVAKDAFIAATERDIYTGDSVEIYVITKEGTRMEVFPLKRD